ncbi:MAG: GNAT family N-acetyltransferase [Bacteroidales bacterium]|nr:GNAT family N-acetyltransferase [Bacteroidales bacterium]
MAKTLSIKHFTDLTAEEFYDIARARETVFLLEQRIVCQDFDGVDKNSFHITLKEDGKILAYLRMFNDGKDTVIGRVLTTERGRGYGLQIMAAAEEAALENFPSRRIILHSQTHAIPFYERCGYSIISEEFLEEGVPHKMMEKIL